MQHRPRIQKGVSRAATVRFVIDGIELDAPAGESLAAALMAAGIGTIRHGPMDGQPRSVFCLIGLCQECLVEIDGMQIEACRVNVSAGMQVNRLRPMDPIKP